MVLPKPFFVLAPMDDVTDTVFRQVVQGNAPADLYFTEFVNVDGLCSPGRPKLMKKLRFAANEGPLVAQLWGLKPENFETIARQIADGTLAQEICTLNNTHPTDTSAQGPTLRTQKSISVKGPSFHACANFVGIDLNMGCPAKGEVQNGACSALIKNRPLAKEIIEATQRGAKLGSGRRLQLESEQGVREERTKPYSNTVKGVPQQDNTALAQKHQQAASSASGQVGVVQVSTMPVSVKTRLGYNEVDLSWHEFLLGFGLDMLTVHWRTKSEMSKVPAHWEYASKLVELRDKIAPDTLLIGNGDVEDREHGEKLAKQYGIDGIMIGRGVFDDPFVFAKRSNWGRVGREERIAMFRRHVQLFADTWQPGERNIHTLNKFCKVYISDFDGAKEMREVLMKCNSTDELLENLNSSLKVQ